MTDRAASTGANPSELVNAISKKRSVWRSDADESLMCYFHLLPGRKWKGPIGSQTSE